VYRSILTTTEPSAFVFNSKGELVDGQRARTGAHLYGATKVRHANKLTVIEKKAFAIIRTGKRFYDFKRFQKLRYKIAIQ
jgi:hypothetical protein